MNSVKMASGPRDVSDFKFVQMRPVQLETNGELEDEVYKRPTQLLAVANKIGLIFAGIRNGFSVVNVGSFETVDISCDPKLKKVPASAANGEVSHTFSVPLPASPSHLAVNSDETIISVALILKGLPVIVMFDTRAVLANRNNAKPFLQIPPNTPPGTFIQDIQWNPVTQNLISVVYSNGSLAIFAVPDDASRPPDCWTLPPAEGITCINWSPKGKQLVAGRNNGSLTQYKPDLKEAKTLSGPDGKNVCPVSILWLSTYQFIVAFKDKDDQDSRPGLYLVQGSKAGSTTFTCFDDICYSMGDNRISNFYSISLSEWGIVLVASANSIEVGILGTQDKEQLNWLQWVPPDGGRAEIPLKPDKSERYPVGVALSISSQRQLQFGEKVSAVSFPILTLLTSDGLLTGFYAVNQDPAAAQITKPCEALSMAGMRKETIELPKPAPTPAQSQPQQPSIPPPPFPTTTPTIPKPFADSPKPGLGFSGQTPFASSTPAKPAPKPVQIGFGTPTAVKPSITPAAAPSPAAQTKPAVAKVEKPKQETISVSDVAVANAILEEMKLFDKDLKKLKERSASLNVNIGSQSEKMELKQGLDSADRFCKDLIEITASQAKEIAELQKTNLQLFSWAEDAKSRDVRNRNPKYRQLLKNRSLDPASQKRMNNLETKFRFVDQQLNQVNEMLDMEWAEHVDRTKSKNLSGHTATKDIVYKAILSNRHLIESEKMTLNKITKDMKALRLKGAVSLGSDKTDQTQMSKMSEMFQEKSKIFDETQKSEVKARAALSSPGIGAGFSPEKHSALRSFLTSKGTTKLKPTKPATLDESIFLKMTTEGKANESKSKALVEQLSKKVDSEMMAKASELASKATSVVPSTAVGLGDQGKSRFGMKQTGSQLQLQEQGPIHKSSSYTGSLSSLSQPGTSTPVSGFASAPKPAFSLDEMSALLQQQVVKPKSKEGTPIFGTTSAVKSGEPQGASFGAILTDENKPLSGFLMKKEASPSAATTTKQSVTQTEQKPIFGLPSTAPEKTTLSAAEPAPLFGGNKASTPVTSSIKPTASEPAGTPIFGNAGQGPKPTSMSGFGDKPSIFGGASAPTPLTAATSATTSGSIFGGASASTPSTAVTSATTPGSIFGGASASESIFGGAALKTSTTAPVSESKPVDGRGVKTSETDASRVVTTTSTGSIFGSSSSSSIFGSNTSSSMFGGSSKPIAPTTTDSVFGTPSTTTSSSTSKSDSTLKPATGTTIFGTTITTTEEKPSGSIFGAASSSGGSIFGGSSSSTLNPSSGSMFGGSTATSPSAATAGGSIFGGSIDTTTAPSGSIFGGSATASAPPGGSIFGGNSSAPAGGSIFGGSSGGSFGKPSASGSIFGATTTAASSGSIFGGSTTTSPSSLFGGGASTTVSGGSIFGGSTVSSPTTTTSSSSTPLFGSGSIFAAAAASSAATSSSSSGTIFGNAPVSKSASLFGVSSNTATSASGAIFGSGGGFFSGLGSSTSSENANKNPFGSATFGQSSSADTSNLFGNQSSGSVFSGSANATGASSGGLFSGSGGSVAAQGFGAGTSPVKSGFGAPATFGGSPAFGSPPAFGSKPAAAFGGPPSLGSSFGAAPAFGSANDAPTFGSLGGSATFGSLSQQAAPPFGTQPQGFGSFAPSGSTTNSGSTTFNASPAFSSWR